MQVDFIKYKHALLHTAVLLLIGILFISLRLYELPRTLDFFGDVGRDFFVLQNWFQTYKPPLLGPQTSVVSFNQSAFYFYMLFPFFLLSGKSLLSTTYAIIGVYALCFVLGFFIIRKYKPQYTYRFFSILLLMSIHPQFVLQHREVWNPSFAAPFLLLASLSLLVVKTMPRIQRMLLFCFSLSIAVSLTYSIIPLALTLFIVYLWQSKNRAQLIVCQFASGLLINMPTVLFELKHNFPLTKTLFSQEMLKQSSDIPMKFRLLDRFMFQNEFLTILIIGLILIAIFFYYYQYKKGNEISYTRQFFLSTLICVAASFLTIYSPISMQAHYIFGIATIIFVLLSFLPTKLLLIGIIGSIFVWLQPEQLQSYLKLPNVTVQEKKLCAQKVCDYVQKPLFVNVNASSHNHQGFEYIYLLKEAGCYSYSAFDYSPDKTDTMIVYSEQQDFELGKTDYYEISLFKPKKVEATINCSENLKAHVLSR